MSQTTSHLAPERQGDLQGPDEGLFYLDRAASQGV